MKDTLKRKKVKKKIRKKERQKRKEIIEHVCISLSEFRLPTMSGKSFVRSKYCEKKVTDLLSRQVLFNSAEFGKQSSSKTVVLKNMI
jgi:hypothetical protein